MKPSETSADKQRSQDKHDAQSNMLEQATAKEENGQNEERLDRETWSQSGIAQTKMAQHIGPDSAAATLHDAYGAQ